MQACRVLSTDDIRMHCMTAPWRPVAPNASPRCAMRLADLFLLVVADRLWVADRVESLASWPPGRAGGRAGGGAPRCTPLNRPHWPGGGRVALDARPSQCPNCGGGGDRGHHLSRTPGHGICTVSRLVPGALRAPHDARRRRVLDDMLPSWAPSSSLSHFPVIIPL